MKKFLKNIITYMLVLSFMSQNLMVFGNTFTTELENIDMELEDTVTKNADEKTLNYEIPEDTREIDLKNAEERIKRIEDLYQKNNSQRSFSNYIDKTIDEYFEGSGTIIDPYIIGTYSDLKYLRDSVDKGNSFKNTYFKQIKNISLKELDENNNVITWSPIGNVHNRFGGEYDGNGKTISNLYIDKNIGLTSEFYGLFGFVEFGTISNVYLEIDYFDVDNVSGGLVGYSLNGKIDNCHVSGILYGNVFDQFEVGGLVGFAQFSEILNSSFNGEITNSYAGGIVGTIKNSNIKNCTSNGTIKGFSGVGGIVGIIFTDTKTTINSCLNTAEIQGDSAVGGIVGHILNSGAMSINITIIRCANQGNIVSENGNVGGIAGKVSGNLTLMQSYNVGDITAKNGTGMAGGIVGEFNRSYNFVASIYMCYNAGLIQSDSILRGTIVGYNFANVSKCYMLANGPILAIGDLGQWQNPSINGNTDANNTTKIYSSIKMRNLGGNIEKPFILDDENNPVNNYFPILESINYENIANISYDFTYNPEKKDYTAKCYYNDNYFYDSSYKYNPSLATMSIALAMSSFNSPLEIIGTDGKVETTIYTNADKNAKELLKKTGFQNIHSNIDFTKEPSGESIGVIFGNKKIKTKDNEYTLIAIGTRGSGYKSEWAGNVTIGETGQHEGFSDGKDEILKELKSYITSTTDGKSEITGDIKIWITGNSRSAAISNLVVGELDNGYSLPNCNLLPENVYAYLFSTPAAALITDISKKDLYKNIFNIINSNDMVPKLAPYSWGFARYGIDRVFPTNATDDEYDYKKSVMIEKFDSLLSAGDYLIDDFKVSDILPNSNTDKITQELFLNTTLSLLIGKVFKSRQYYNENYEEAIRNMLIQVNKENKKELGKFTENLLEEFKKDININRMSMYVLMGLDESLNDLLDLMIDRSLTDVEGLFSEEDINDLVDLITKLVINFAKSHFVITYNLVKNIKGIGQAHYTDVGFSWLQAMDPNYTSSPITFADTGSYRILKVNCPVDIEVFNESNTLVAAIKSNIPETILDSSIISSVNEDDEKIVYLPASNDYSIKLKATDDGKMSYSIQEYSFEVGDINRIVNYYDIPIQKNEILVSNIPAYSQSFIEEGSFEGTTTEYTFIDSNNKQINPNVDISGDEAINSYYTVDLKSENEDYGVVSGQGTRSLGSFAKIYADANDGYEFECWYDNFTKISDESSYRFRVESDIDLIAKFTKKNPSGNENVVIERIELGSVANDYLPGETQTIKSSDLKELKNLKNEKVIVEVELNPSGTLILSNYEDYGDDYKLDSETGEIKFSSRLKDVISFKMSNADKWIEVDGKYYIGINANQSEVLGNLRFSLLPELGGNRVISRDPIVRTMNRQWEQTSSFEAAYTLKTITGSENTVKDIFGQDVYDEIINKGHGESESDSDSWFN